MNNQSVLQQQFPLHPKKFWKKIIEVLPTFFLLFIGLAAAVIGTWFIFTSPESSNHPNFSALVALSIAAIIIMLGIVVLYAWYIKIYIKNYFYAGEEHFITIKKGVFAPTEIHVQWQKIQDVYVDQDILDRIMGLYDVHIASATAASGIEAHIDGVDKAAAEGLKNFLLGKISGTSTKTGATTQAATHTTTANEARSAAPVTLSTAVSSEKYPLSNKWLALRTVTTIVSSVIYSFIFVAYGYLKFSSKNDQGPIAYYIVAYIALTAAIVIFRLVSLYLWKENYAFNFTEHTIHFREGVLSLSEKNMPYSSIQDVTVQQGIIERIFGLANVVIENAAQMTIQGRNGANLPIFSGLRIQGISREDAQTITTTLKEATLNKRTSQNGL